jgi:hypothetical protein
MSSNETNEDIGGILVSVEPQQSSYFAGEPFSAKITFMNTRPAAVSTAHSQSAITYTKSGVPVPVRPSSAAGSILRHKRGAHSITYGSAPLANPPTSPGTPHLTFASSTPSLTQPSNPTKHSTIARKGLVGIKHQNGQLGRESAREPNDFPVSAMGGPAAPALSADQMRKLMSRRTLSVDTITTPSIPNKQELPNGKEDGKFYPCKPFSSIKSLNGI